VCRVPGEPLPHCTLPAGEQYFLLQPAPDARLPADVLLGPVQEGRRSAACERVPGTPACCMALRVLLTDSLGLAPVLIAMTCGTVGVGAPSARAAWDPGGAGGAGPVQT